MAGGGRLFRRLFLDLHPQKSMGFIKMHFLSPAALCPVHLLRDLSVAVGGAALSVGLGQPWVRRAPLSRPGRWLSRGRETGAAGSPAPITERAACCPRTRAIRWPFAGGGPHLHPDKAPESSRMQTLPGRNPPTNQAQVPFEVRPRFSLHLNTLKEGLPPLPPHFPPFSP